MEVVAAADGRVTTMHSQTTLSWSPSWTIAEQADGTVLLSAGADRQLTLNGAAANSIETLSTWQHGPVLTSSDDEELLLDRLVDAGVVGPDAPAQVAVFGDRDQAAALSDVLRPHVKITSRDSADVVVMLRSREGWPDPPAVPHLAVDAHLHHTFVLGPYVVPGRSACTRCLDTRVARRWPAPPLPRQPGAQRWVAVLGELLRIQLELISLSRSPLVNATIAWDLELGTADRQTLLKVPGCESCRTPDPSGRTPLPWTDRPPAS